MGYIKTDWKNLPTRTTPVTKGNLNHMEQGIYDATYENGLNVSNEVDEDYRVNLLKGKNLFDKNNFIKLDGIYISMSNGAIGSYQGNKTLVIQCNPSTTYTIQKISGATFRAGSYATYPSVGTNALTYQINSTGTTITITTGSTAKYLCVQYFGTDDTQTESTILNSIQIELGSTATSYEPYITPSIYVDNEEIYNKEDTQAIQSIDGYATYWKVGDMVFCNILSSTSTPTQGVLAIIPDELRPIRRIQIRVFYYNGNAYVNGQLIADRDTKKLYLYDAYGNVPSTAQYISGQLFWKIG